MRARACLCLPKTPSHALSPPPPQHAARAVTTCAPTQRLQGGPAARQGLHAHKREARSVAFNGGAHALTRLRYRVEEVLDAESGEMLYEVVSADGSERVECSSRAAADKVHRALEAAP